MKALFAVAMIALLAGCSSAEVKQAMGDLHTDCVRHYQGVIGGMLTQTNVTFDITCKPANPVIDTPTTIGGPTSPAPKPAGGTP